jgi:uncharacterized repeat protein (TIGR01451 family)
MDKPENKLIRFLKLLTSGSRVCSRRNNSAITKTASADSAGNFSFGDILMNNQKFALNSSRFARGIATILLGGLLSLSSGVYAADALSITVDADGPDDVPLQEDVTRMGFDTSHLSELDPYWSIFFAFDDVAMTGGNSGDGCAFFDGDEDGFADFALCASFEGDPAMLVTSTLYDCKDSENAGDQGARCPFTGGGGDGSSGIIARDTDGDGMFDVDGDGNTISLDSNVSDFNVTSPDPFFGDPLHVSGNCRFDTGNCLALDTGILFQIFVDELVQLDPLKPMPTNISLTNVCSFTSLDPGSERKDCIVNPGSGFLTIVKQIAEGDPDATFTYNLDGAPYETITTVGGTGQTDSNPLPGGVNYTLEEILPSEDWGIVSAVCDNGTPTDTTDDVDLLTSGGVFTLGEGERETCTFTNEVVFVAAPAIDIIKTVVNDGLVWNDANGNSSPDAGETVDYTFDVQNIGNVALSSVDVIDALIDGEPNLSDVLCPQTTLAPENPLPAGPPYSGETMQCTGTYALTQADIDAVRVDNTATAEGFSPTHVRVDDTDYEEIELPWGPAIELVKTGSLDLGGDGIATPGDLINYSFTIENIGNVTLTNVDLADLGLDSVSALGTTTLAPGESTTATGTYAIDQTDIDAGVYDNTAITTGDCPDTTGLEPPLEPPRPTTDCASDTDSHNEPIPQTPSIDIVKTGTFNDTNGRRVRSTTRTVTALPMQARPSATASR